MDTNRMISLHKNLQEKYEKQTIQHLWQWEKEVIRVSDSINHRIFTLRCLGSNITPVSIRLRPIRSRQSLGIGARKIIERAE